jgi:5-oxoprolinase (ATP-hydrolysing) subunit A
MERVRGHRYISAISGRTIDINADVGQGFGRWSLGDDEGLMDVISSASVACGFHAGDPLIMRRTVELAKARGVAVGAHTGTPDVLGFGRRIMELTGEEAYAYTLYQLGALREFLHAAGLDLHHVKPHGAMYALLRDPEVADGVARAIDDVMVEPVLYWAAPDRTGPLAAAAARRGIELVRLVDAGELDLTELPAEAQSIQVRGDAAGACERAREIRQSLERLGAEVSSQPAAAH